MTISGEITLRACGVWKNYGGFRALEPMDLELKSGCVTALLGANGAGKSTLLRIISGLLSPSGGSVERNGKLGYLSGDTQLYGRLTPLETLEFFGGLHGLSGAVLRKRLDLVIEKMQLAPFLDKPVGGLSSGMRQRVNIGRALIHDPEIIIFDEATTALDFVAAAFIVDHLGHLRKEGKSLLFSTHILSEADFLADEMVVLRKGIVIEQCSKEEFLTKYDSSTVTEALLRSMQRAEEEATTAEV